MAYDLIVIGGGPAGYLACERAGQEGLETLLFEKRSIGGVCLNEGCIPSKTFLHSAKIYDYARNSDKYGVTTEGARLNHAVVVRRKNKVVRTLVSGVESKLKKNGVKTVNDTAVIMGRSSEGFTVAAGEEEFSGRRLLVATGSMPVIPPIDGLKEGLENGFVLTNREVFDLSALPGSIAIIGGGVVGLELASYFNSAGSSVTVIEMLDHVAGDTDREITGMLVEEYSKKGIEFKFDSKVVKVGNSYVVFEHSGEKTTIECDKVLLSVGRRPVTQGIGLENAGIEVYKGAVRTDDMCRTNIPGAYAAGDVNGISLFAHTAYREAEVCVSNMLGKLDRVRYNAIPAVIYTNPEVSVIGETEESARQKGMDVEMVKISMRYSGRYVAENEGGRGIIKIVLDKKHRTLKGAHMIGNYSSEIIYGAGLMIETEMRIDDIEELVFPHPTVSEIIREAVFAADELM